MDLPTRLRRLAGVGSRFLVVGAVSTLIEVGVFNLLVFVWGWDVVAAKIAASLVALINAYIGNREWTFRHRDRRGRVAEVVLFLATNVVCTAIGAALVWVGVEIFTVVLDRQPGAVAVNVVNLTSIVIVVMLRFVLYHGIVFRVSPPK
ncbi:GtrA family protein [Microbacterium paraoxydans]|uniref:GtrA family protein n=1 Tax=Microbacterium paraoxydans TaxID=199592 RepID=UPI001CF99B43|nr:GtrA family protein [Microbacterium paraoxydans]